MPLNKSKTEEAFKSNVAEMVKASHPMDQSLAAAYRVKREKRAKGGFTPPRLSFHSHPLMKRPSLSVHAGPIPSAVGGRTDHHPMSVSPGSYVLPADHVSSLGQGNTANGMAVLNHMFTGGMYGSAAAPKMAKGTGAPKAPKLRAAGGAATDDRPIPIYAAGGEYVIPPEVVTMVGNGDIKHGHAILDKWVKENRKNHIQTLKKLPPPATK